MKINHTNPIKFSLPHQLLRTHVLRQRLFSSLQETLNMSDRTHLERCHAGRSKCAGVWRHARQAVALAVVMLMIVGSWQVKVGAVAGDLDTSFNNDGRLVTNFGVDDSAQAVAIQANGRIVVAGYTGSDPIRDFAVARYHGD